MKLDDEQIEKLQQLDDLHYEITCKEDVLKILEQHKRLIDLLMDMVGLLSRAENIRIDRAKQKK